MRTELQELLTDINSLLLDAELNELNEEESKIASEARNKIRTLKSEITANDFRNAR